MDERWCRYLSSTWSDILSDWMVRKSVLYKECTASKEEFCL